MNSNLITNGADTIPEIKLKEPELKKPDPQAIMTIGRGLVLKTLDDMWQFAAIAVKSNVMPKGDTKEDIFIKLEYGAELGLAPMQSLQNIAVINGRPALWGDAVPGVVEASGKQEYGYPSKIGQRNPDGSYPDTYGYKYTTKRQGRAEYSYEYTVKDAKQAKLWSKDGTWTFYPDRMLLNRARTFCVRDVYPDILKGIITIDEASDIINAEYTVEEPKSQTEKLANLIVPKLKTEETIKSVNKETGEVIEPEPKTKQELIAAIVDLNKTVYHLNDTDFIQVCTEITGDTVTDIDKLQLNLIKRIWQVLSNQEIAHKLPFFNKTKEPELKL